MPNLGPEYVDLGRALRALRRAAGLTQVQAAAIRVSSASISQIERGERGCRWHTLLKLLDAYGSDLSALAAEIAKQAKG